MHFTLRELLRLAECEFHALRLARRDLYLVLQPGLGELHRQVFRLELLLKMLFAHRVLLEKVLELLLKTVRENGFVV